MIYLNQSLLAPHVHAGGVGM
jgi:hypothetical protein